jgi:hypothetical protein
MGGGRVMACALVAMVASASSCLTDVMGGQSASSPRRPSSGDVRLIF